MNSRDLRSLLLALPLALPAVLLPACQSSAPDQAARTTDDMTVLATEFKVAGDMVGKSLAALEALADSADADMRPRYDAFAKSVSQLESQRGRVSYLADKMKGSGSAYFKNWEQSIQSLSNPEFQKRSRERLDEARKNYDEARQYVDGTSERFDAVLSDFKDVREYLGHDLNKSGLDTIKDLIKDSKKTGEDVQKRIEKVVGALQDVSKAMSANNAPPPAEG